MSYRINVSVQVFGALDELHAQRIVDDQLNRGMDFGSIDYGDTEEIDDDPSERRLERMNSTGSERGELAHQQYEARKLR